jgi:membrane protease YdiL (CAAX protease family)
MWCPAVAALITQFLYRQDASAFGWQWGRTRYQLLSYAIPVAYALPVYAVVWASGLGGFYDEAFVKQVANDFGWDGLAPGLVIAAYVPISASVGMVQSCASALGEEIGWRGFLVPHLAKVTGFRNVALISGLMWAVWHYPIFLFADYNSGTPAWYGLTCFTVSIIGVSFVFAWMRLKSGSLWTAMLIHASHNLFIRRIFTPLTTDTGHTKCFIDEFGAGLAITTVIAGLIAWKMRGNLPSQSELAHGA